MAPPQADSPTTAPDTGRPLRIAMVIDAWDDANNGAVVSTHRFTEALRGRGHTVEVLATGQPMPGKVPLRSFVIPTPGNRREPMWLPFARPDRRLIEPVLARQDVVHNQFPFWLGVRAITLAHRAGVPVVSSFHVQAENLLRNLGVQSPAAARWVYRFFVGQTYNRSEHVICPSGFAERELRRYGLAVSATVISNGVPPEYRPLPRAECERFEGRFTILSVGRLAREKRHDLLIEAIRRSRHEARIQLVILGDGPLKAQLEAQGQVLTNAPVFRRLKPQELVRYYGGADLCVHAAEVELECMSVLEAMACGLPCLIARSPLSATQQFAPSEAHLFKAGDREALTAGIDRWIGDAPGLERARAASRAVAERYTVEASVEKLIQVYRQVAGRKVVAR
jgi:glycosyltransferase involved in cell wall biosynthesis